MKNVVHTPHMGDSTQEAQKDSRHPDRAAGLRCHAPGADYRNAVNNTLYARTPSTRWLLISSWRNGSARCSIFWRVVASVAWRWSIRARNWKGLVKPLTVGLLKGILEPVLGTSVNYIQCAAAGDGRSIHVTQTKGLDVVDYTNLVSCQVHWEGGGQMVVSGALFNRKEPRIVQIDTYATDFVPEGTMLVFSSYDVPGIIA
ncbi:MAG: hypothetical protein U0528_14955 [Anaerolineae bacterium]